MCCPERDSKPRAGTSAIQARRIHVATAESDEANGGDDLGKNTALNKSGQGSGASRRKRMYFIDYRDRDIREQIPVVGPSGYEHYLQGLRYRGKVPSNILRQIRLGLPYRATRPLSPAGRMRLKPTRVWPYPMA